MNTKNESDEYKKHSTFPTSRTYHFHQAKSFANDDSESEDTDSGKFNLRGFQYPWSGYEMDSKVVSFKPQKYERFYAQNNT